MLGVGVAVGVTFVTVNGLWVTCVLVCKKKLVWNSGIAFDNKEVFYHKFYGQRDLFRLKRMKNIKEK